MKLAILPAAVLLLAAAVSAQREVRFGSPPATTKADGVYTRIDLTEPKKGTAWLYAPESAKARAPDEAGLIVCLHGHGGRPKNMLRWRQPLIDGRGDYALSVQGSRATESGGRAWDSADVPMIVDMIRWALGHHPIAAERVVLLGHSAGGGMAIRTYARARTLVSGAITNGCPLAPPASHAGGRYVSFFGTKDFNLPVADRVRQALGGRAKWRNGCLYIVDGAAHNDLPGVHYLDLALDWCLRRKVRGGEAKIPLSPPPRTFSSYRLLLIAHKKSEPLAGGTRKKIGKAKAKKQARAILKELKRGAAWLPFEAQARSDHAPSAPHGGLVSLETLAALDPALAEAARGLEPGGRTAVLGTRFGFAVVGRDIDP